ncbi:protein adenylyltransferase SelO family protein [Corynebacterium pseudotuberculosis]|uniref:protein adenylyltransferase SelO family protein n=2 Tax=Corynebacterium pseudotuberculosis TaxID=1719 RepID=UPI0034E1C48B
MPYPTFLHTFAEHLPSLAVPHRACEWPDPQLVVFNDEVGAALGITRENICDVLQAEGHAQAYSGHQFGNFVPLLGVGRALLVGELTAEQHLCGEAPGASLLYDVHLKGSGRTVFSRGGDGRAALGPMLREYLVSESLHALGVPSSRSLAVITTGETILRDRPQPGAVLVRVAPNHLRVGTLQFAAINGAKVLRDTVRYASHRVLPEPGNDELANARELLHQAVLSQARLIAQWMRFGFVHGVMNTDNTTLSGYSIDFGPCAFLDTFNPHAVFSSIDHEGRYAYAKQPAIAGWNLARMAETLLPFIGMEAAREEIDSFASHYRTAWLEEMAQAVGVDPHAPDAEKLLDALPEILTHHDADLTTFLRSLSDGTTSQEFPWARQWCATRDACGAIPPHNPVYIPRNHLVEEALLQAERGDLSHFQRLIAATTTPFIRQDNNTDLEEPGPKDSAPYITYCGT